MYSEQAQLSHTPHPTQVVARVTTVMMFAALELDSFSNLAFDSSVRADYAAALADFAKVVVDDVVIELINAGSVVVTADVFFSETALGEPETFAEQMDGYALSDLTLAIRYRDSGGSATPTHVWALRVVQGPFAPNASLDASCLRGGVERCRATGGGLSTRLLSFAEKTLWVSM
jgi:hypothetical protein